LEGVVRGRLYELFKAKDPEAARLATIHNVWFFNDLMRRVRESLREGKFSDLKKEFLGR
jgi:queuine tRNA-ribosyltransferase